MNFTRRIAITLFATAASAAAIVLPACGAEGPAPSSSGGDPGTPTSVVDHAIADTIDTDTIDVEMKGAVRGFLSPQEVTLHSRLDRPAHRASFQLESGGESVEAVVVGDDAYVSSSASAFRDALDGKSWLTDLPDDAMGSWDGNTYDPSTDLLYKLTGHGPVKRTGTSSVAGDPVTTYRFSVADGVPDGVPSDRRAGVRKLVRATGAGKITIDAEVGIDDDGHVRSVNLDAEVRRASSTSTVSAKDDDPFGDQPIELTWDAEITSIDEPVEIQEPDRSDTVDFADVPDGQQLLSHLHLGND